MTRVLAGDPLEWTVEGPTALTIGVFDGLHLGHRAVMDRLVERARRDGLHPAALTFDPHPLEFVAPEHAPKLLTSVAQRIELLGECGIETVGILPFPEIRDLSPETFAVDLLGGRLHAGYVAVGTDFRFGHNRAGDVPLLRSLGRKEGFEVEAIDLVAKVDGEVVSSTRIRAALAEGDVKTAAALLGRNFEVRGGVVHGDARGVSIGFPTANIHVPDRMAIPADGVYAVWCRIDGRRLPAVVNIGIRPTFAGTHRTVEVHVLDVDEDMYGRELAVEVVERLRDEKRFDSVEALVAQLGSDVATARDVLGV